MSERKEMLLWAVLYVVIGLLSLPILIFIARLWWSGMVDVVTMPQDELFCIGDRCTDKDPSS